MNQIPGIVQLNHVREGRHGRAIHTGHEDLVDILVGNAALETRIVSARGEVVGADRIVLAVGERGGGRAVTLAVRTVTFPAFQFRKQSLAVGNALDGDRRLGRNRDWRAGFFMLPSGREDLDIRHQVGALLLAKGIPDRHVGVVDAASDGVEEIFIGGERARQGGAALESGYGKVARLRIEPNRVLAVGISVVAVAAGTVASEVGLRVRSMPGEVADVALHRLDHNRWLRTYGGLILGEGPRSKSGNDNQPENRNEKNRADKTHWLQALHSQHPSTEVSAGETSSPADSSSSEIKIRNQSQFQTSIRWCLRWWHCQLS